ncbi:cation:proton antiporter [Chitinophaga sancti]|uniref:Monovalent cation:H+ antiporter, CPA1 family n=1 Tax=Chitinophaga sancti TaxID=1004 RepID=A0A1K1QXP6_9BACT|nr:sodium:proton antiporter [Chitinophaga sancti]WQD62058.1 sodium:proton antiporter [Chitinophaga sancti]WQG92373.1 sodium:proton antiporter [Chitinophaga sancti]SFW64648.1 monovalent cation:H+ antiporter, CPA1 family [Chitinophaga sancti]
MDTFTIIAALITISALISYLNLRFIKLPGAIGVMFVSILLSIFILVTGKAFPTAFNFIRELTRSIDFTKTLLDIMLAFLLFASAFHFEYKKLREQKRPVLVLSTIGVVGSTIIFGLLLDITTTLLGIDLPLVYCFLFGALISPTDPVAVMSVLKKSRIPSSLETIISGESLLNDGVGLILFVTIGEVAAQEATFSMSHALELFAKEVFGGLALGTATAVVTGFLTKKIQEFQTAVLVSISMVMMISIMGGLLHVSIPLAAVAAGLILGSSSIGAKSNKELQDYLHRFWELIDELLNIILFVMIGLQIVVLPFIGHYWFIGLVAVLFVLIARGVSIAVPSMIMRRSLKTNFNNTAILVWAGLRGGISVALALSLPESPYKKLILSASYIIVVFSVIVQGLTLNRVVNRFVK